MSEPIVELISRNIEDTLKALCVVGGYWADATVCRPRPGSGYELKHGRVLIIQGDPEPDPSPVLGKTGRIQPYSIVCDVAVSQDSADGIDTWLNRIAADVEKALTTDEGSSYRRGGYAIDTIAREPEFAPIVPNSHVGRVVVNVDVYYRTAERNPFTK
jgi:hypothetical protein